MKLVVQRVKKANVVVEEKTVGEIKQGFMVLIGVAPTDTKEIQRIIKKHFILKTCTPPTWNISE